MDLGGARVFAQPPPRRASGLPWMARKGEASSLAFGLEPGGTALFAGAGRERANGRRDPVGVNGWVAGARKAFGYPGISGAPSYAVLQQAGERSIGRMMPGG